jgi:hypothetical protein
MKNSNLSFSEFDDAFRNMNRLENFSYEGRRALYIYLTEIEEDTGEEMELDVIALCCEYAEDALDQILKDYSNIEGLETLEDLQEHTWAVEVGHLTGHNISTILYQQF